MAENLRTVRLLVGTAWRTDRRLTLLMLIDPLGNTLALLAGLWLALLTDGVLRHQVPLVVVGAVGLVVGSGLAWQLELSSSQWRMVLSEKVGHAFDTELARLSATLPGLEHQERADLQDKLELLRERQGLLGNSMGTLAVTVKAAFAAGAVLVLLTVVHPVMLATIVLALPSLWVTSVQQRWRAAAEDESAPPGRIARQLRALAYDRDAGTEIRVFGLADEIDARATRAWADHRRPVERAERRAALLSFLHEAGYVAGSTAAVAFVAWRARRGLATPGDVVLAIYLCQQVQAAVVWPIQAVAGLGQTLRTARRFLWLREFAASTAARYTGDRPAPPTLTGGIVFDDVSLRYPGTDTWALRHVSVSIPAGSVVALVGENGAGKTTFVKLLARMYEPTEGRILVDGVDLATIDLADWRRHLSAAFQDFARFEFSVQHAVGVGDLPGLDDEHRVADALDRAGADDLLPTLPAGMATELGARWQGVDLSTGQWQKLALGRAMMRTEPLLVFFDEPTAALDAPSEHALFERYVAAARSHAARGTITVLVSHRFSTVSAARQILVLADRGLVEVGSHDELLAAGGLYADLYRLQARSYLD